MFYATTVHELCNDLSNFTFEEKFANLSELFNAIKLNERSNYGFSGIWPFKTSSCSKTEADMYREVNGILIVGMIKVERTGSLFSRRFC